MTTLATTLTRWTTFARTRTLARTLNRTFAGTFAGTWAGTWAATIVLAGGITGATAIGGATAALADSCWNHNGSLMRLTSNGNQRFMYYERPRQVLRNAGVRRGTLFFNGTNNGDYYSGTARRFSKFCPGSPLTYYVEGPVSRPNGQIVITIEGQRPVHNRCQPTGRSEYDSLRFTYVRDC